MKQHKDQKEYEEGAPATGNGIVCPICIFDDDTLHCNCEEHRDPRKP